MSNVINGLQFEMDFTRFLRVQGFWVHRIVPNVAGQQPADIIAVKGVHHLLIDCKLITSGHRFCFSRVEDNQRSSMDMFKIRGGEQGWFALMTPSKRIWMIGLDTILELERFGVNALGEKDMDKYCEEVGVWLTRWIQ